MTKRELHYLLYGKPKLAFRFIQKEQKVHIFNQYARLKAFMDEYYKSK